MNKCNVEKEIQSFVTLILVFIEANTKVGYISSFILFLEHAFGNSLWSDKWRLKIPQ